MMTKTKLRRREKILRFEPMSEFSMDKRFKVFENSGKKSNGAIKCRISGIEVLGIGIMVPN